VLSVDEKTSVQAKSRKHPTRALQPGQAERREFEYVRHGTVSLMAALNVHNGQVLGQIIARNDSATFTSFLTWIDQAVDPVPAENRIGPLTWACSSGGWGVLVDQPLRMACWNVTMCAIPASACQRSLQRALVTAWDGSPSGPSRPRRGNLG